MKISWEINNNDIQKVRDFVNQNSNNSFVIARKERNIKRKNIVLDENTILKNLLMCLLTTQQRSGPNSLVSLFLRQNPFPITVETISAVSAIEDFISKTMKKNELNRFNKRIPHFFALNYKTLQSQKWEIIDKLRNDLNGQQDRDTERKIADDLNGYLKGFGPKQSRNFLQGLGLTKYEIPIDSRITRWLKDFNFPITLTATSLQDKEYYHFVSDGIQSLCEKAGVWPCVFDAAIFSFFNIGEWSDKNSTIY